MRFSVCLGERARARACACVCACVCLCACVFRKMERACMILLVLIGCLWTLRG